MERARQAARDGRLDDALQAYRAAITNSPDSPFLYREFAAVELRKGQTDEALASFRKAVSLDPSDATSHAQIGEILDSRNELEDAERAYMTALANGAPPAVNTRARGTACPRMALARLPAEYRAIDQAAQITRADLAALIGIRLAPLLESVRRSDAALMTDVRAHWAAPWIFAVARAGVMEPFDNHAFQPRSIVRRVDLAQAVARLLPQAGIKRRRNCARGSRRGCGSRIFRRHTSPTRRHRRRSRQGHEDGRRQRVSAVAAGHGRRSDRGDRPPRGACRSWRSMTALTPANQLTLLRMFLIPGS